MAKNGDMVRPQVKAVLDLLLSGIEIDSDFGKGYEALVDATSVKAGECTEELNDFYARYSGKTHPLSIHHSAELTRGKIQQRQDEVTALLDASHAHLVADHSRLDVLLSAGEKDIEEWASLTLQLIENAFHNAEQSYLSNLWPTPPATPRLELLPEDEDRVGKLKALLNATQAEAGNMRSIDSNSASALALLNGGGHNTTSKIDPEKVSAILGGALEDDEEIEEEMRRRRKEARKAEKERRRQEKEAEAARRAEELANVDAPKIKPDQTRELQQGCFECVTAEGYTYYFNPETGNAQLNSCTLRYVLFCSQGLSLLLPLSNSVIFRSFNINRYETKNNL